MPSSALQWTTCACFWTRTPVTKRPLRPDIAVKQYERLIGPVNFYDAGGTCTWNWTCAPWPWETEDENDVEL